MARCRTYSHVSSARATTETGYGWCGLPARLPTVAARLHTAAARMHTVAACGVHGCSLRCTRFAACGAHGCSLRCTRFAACGAYGCSLRCPRLQVLPACLGGDLSDLLEAEGRLDEEQGRFYAGCVILALRCLHGLGIVYRDLKPENILLTAEGWPVLTDFGLVAFLDDGRATSMVGGTPPSPWRHAPRSHPEIAPRDRDARDRPR